MGFKSRQREQAPVAADEAEPVLSVEQARTMTQTLDITDTPELTEAFGVRPWDIPSKPETLVIVSAPSRDILRAAGYEPYERRPHRRAKPTAAASDFEVE